MTAVERRVIKLRDAPIGLINNASDSPTCPFPTHPFMHSFPFVVMSSTNALKHQAKRSPVAFARLSGFLSYPTAPTTPMGEQIAFDSAACPAAQLIAPPSAQRSNEMHPACTSWGDAVSTT
jgi:hypothetical protein